MFIVSGSVLRQFTQANGARSGIARVAVLVSDGFSDAPEGQYPYNNAAQLRNSGVTIYTVGLTDSPNTNDLATISSGTAYQYYINSNNNATTAASQVLSKLCS